MTDKQMPHKVVKQQIEELYIQISRIGFGPICIYPDLARDLDELKKATSELFDKTLTIDPESILFGK